MTRANGWIGGAARRAEAWPLAYIAGAMLAGATAFFCYAMPARLLAAMPGPFGVAATASAEGRIAFGSLAALLAGGLGWLAVTAAGSRRKPVASDAEPDVAATPRRRPIGPSNPSEALNARPPTLLSVRRGDGHPDAPPRRPVFAHELGRSLESVDEEAIDVPVRDEAPEPVEFAKPAPAEPDDAAPDTPEPLELLDPLPPVPADRDEKPSLAALMARFEDGIDRRGGGEAAAEYDDIVAPIRPDPRNADDTLREALAALQRMAARQR